MKEVVESKEQIFQLRFKKSHGRLNLVLNTSIGLARRLISALELDAAELERLLPGHVFNPYVILLLKAIERFEDLLGMLAVRDALVDDEATRLVDRLNEMVAVLRAEGRSKSVVDTLDNWARRVRARGCSAKRYVDRIFEVYADVLAIRIDLAYCMQGSGALESWASPVSLAQAKKHMAKFDRFMRENYPVAGHMHCREYGLLSGYHFHVLYFLNRTLKQRDIHIARELGEHWEDVITEGQGRHYNCNAQHYRRRGIGKILHYDAVKRAILMNDVVSYITKADFWISQEDGKSFVKGVMPPAPSGLGRPRKHSIIQSCGDSVRTLS